MTLPGARRLASVRDVSKSFGAQRVLRRVSFDVQAGEVHILAGENGAGKSTLVKVLAGILGADEGRVDVQGRVAVIHQELSLVGAMSVVDNLFLGRDRWWLRRAERRRQARTLLARVGLDADPDRAVEELPLEARQRVEIAKALARDASILVMDEATSALSASQVDRLFTLVAELRSRGTGIVFITHKMEEIYRIGDRITVLRDGELIASAPPGALPRDALVRAMVGRDITEQIPREPHAQDRPILRVRDLNIEPRVRGEPAVRGISFDLRAGEVLGLAGLEGSGIETLLHALFGDRRARGLVEGGSGARGGPGIRAAMRRGVALLTNDRASSGLCLGLSVADNITLAGLRRLTPLGLRVGGAEPRAARDFASATGVRCDSLSQPIGTLSGGNQQKAALAKWACTHPRVFLLHDPTRGVDVGAKHEIYGLIRRWTRDGIGIILASSELPELLGLSDRLLVLHRGRIVREFAAGAAPEAVIAAAMGEETQAVSAAAAEGSVRT